MGICFGVCLYSFHAVLMKRSTLPLIYGRYGPGALMLDAQAMAGSAELAGLVARAVIRQYPLYCEAMRGVSGNGIPQKPHGRVGGFVVQYRRVDGSGCVINTDMRIHPAGVTERGLPRSGLFVSVTVNFARPLDIQVEPQPEVFHLYC